MGSPVVAQGLKRVDRFSFAGGWVLGPALSLVATVLLALWVRAVHFDDPYITFRYAANLRDGHGLVFNPGEPVLATTTPLFSLLLGALGTLLPGIEIAVLGYWVSLIALWAAAALLGLICWREGQKAAAVVVGPLVVLCASLVPSLGMETPLYLAFGFLGFYLWRERLLWQSGFALALLALTRPDGIILAAIIALAELLQARRLPWRAGAVFAAVLAPWYGYAWLAYGSPFPFSLAAKMAQAQTGWWQTMGEATWQWLLGLATQAPVYVLLALLGLAYAAWRVRWALLVLAWPLTQVLGYSVLGVAYYSWYLAPLHAVLSLFVALGIGLLLVAGERFGSRGRPIGVTLAGLAAALVLVPSLQFAQTFGANVPDPKMRQYEQVGTWLRDNTPAGSVVAALEMGRLGYFGERPMFDFVGLVKPPVAEHLRQKDLLWSVKEYRPEYAVTIAPDLWLLEDQWFRAAYLPLREFSDEGVYDGQPTIVFARAVGSTAHPPLVTSAGSFGDSIELIGYTILPTAPAGNTLDVILHWRALKPVDADYTAFVHVLDEDGRMLGQLDGQPLDGAYPTSSWQAGEYILDQRRVQLAEGKAAAGLRVGWYLLETMQKLPAAEAAGKQDEYLLLDLNAGR